VRSKPIKACLTVVLAACGLLCAERLWPAQSISPTSDLKLPAVLAKYKDWKTLLRSPKPVPFQLWVQCIAATPADWDQAKKKYGPHSGYYIQVYANQIAAQSFVQGKMSAFAVGSVIAKEKILSSADGSVVGVAFMTKRSEPRFAVTGGWEFSYYPKSGETEILQQCGSCHGAVADRDYVFGQYPSAGDPLAPPQSHRR
jgi:mono/diheme cytochrome c family protein